MSQLPEKEAVQAINDSFIKWGLPQRIKIDGGRPFVHPSDPDVPTLSFLWWTGLGIEVVINTPGCPQQNGTVEGLQGICERWVNPNEYDNIQAFQIGLDEVGHIQRQVYKIPKFKYKTRMELYPELVNKPRPYTPQQFCMDLVFDFLAQKVWHRKVKTRGTVKVFGQEVYVGCKLKHWPVTVTFDPIDNAWIIRTTAGALLKTADNKIFTENRILEHVNLSKN